MKGKGKKKKRSGRDRWDGVLNRNCPPPPRISDLYQGRRPVFEEISTAIRCKWVEAKNERLFDQLRDDPISWQRAVRCKRGWNGSGCVFSLCPRLKHQSSTDNNSPLKRISPSSKDNQLSHLIFTVEPLLFRIHRNPWFLLIISSVSLFPRLILLREAWNCSTKERRLVLRVIERWKQPRNNS